jgi:hypothetical protein
MVSSAYLSLENLIFSCFGADAFNADNIFYEGTDGYDMRNAVPDESGMSDLDSGLGLGS